MKNNTTPWPQEMVDAFRGMLENSQMAYPAIAAELSSRFGIELTANACIGKAHRLGLPRRYAVKPRVEALEPEPDEPAAEPEAAVDNRPPGSLTIQELSWHSCRWPLGHFAARPPYFYCGQQKAAAGSYCPAHAKLSYIRPRQ